MNEREIREIKKNTLCPEGLLGTIYGCFVNGQKNIVCKWKKKSIVLEEEEIHKYSDALKSTLNGKIGVSLYNLEKTDGNDKELLAVVNNNEDAIDALFQKIIDTIQYTENFCILIVTNKYDVPTITLDQNDLEDGSETTYSYALVSVLNVTLTKPSLGYRRNEQDFSNIDREFVLGKPIAGFLYPSFTERTATLNEVLYMSKKEIHQELIKEVLGCKEVAEPSHQHNFFSDLLNEADITIHAAAEVSEKLEEKADENGELTKETLIEALEEAEIDPKNVVKFYDETFGENQSVSSNALFEKTIKVQAGATKITTSKDIAKQIHYTVVDGEKYILIPAGDIVTVNGIEVERD